MMMMVQQWDGIDSPRKLLTAAGSEFLTFQECVCVPGEKHDPLPFLQGYGSDGSDGEFYFFFTPTNEVRTKCWSWIKATGGKRGLHSANEKITFTCAHTTTTTPRGEICMLLYAKCGHKKNRLERIVPHDTERVHSELATVLCGGKA